MSGRRTINVGEVVLAGFRLCGARWKELLKVTALTMLPASVFGLLVLSTFMPDALMDALADPEAPTSALEAVPSTDWVNLAIAFAFYVVVTSVASTWALAASIFIAIEEREGRAMTHNDALRAGAKKLASLFWLMFFSGLLMLIGLLACIAPGVWLFVSWAVAPVVLIREELKGTKAMGRSFRMVKPVFWLAFVVMALEVATLLVLQTVAGIVPNLVLIGAAENNSFASFFSLSLASAFASLFGIALHAAISSELYAALKEREAPAAEAVMPPPVLPPPPPPMGL